MRTSAVSDVMVLEIDQTLVSVSAVHGVVRASSAQPPQRSSTSVPRSTTARLAPSSSPVSRCCWNVSRRAENRSSAEPWTGVLVIERLLTSADRVYCGAATYRAVGMR